jgi:hypothetical protein
MKIEISDMFSGERVKHEVVLTTEHPASHYGIPVAVFPDGAVLDVFHWLLGSGRVLEFTPEEDFLLSKWESSMVGF